MQKYAKSRHDDKRENLIEIMQSIFSATAMLVKTYLVAGDNDLLTYINGNKSGKNNVPLMLECQHILSVPNRSPRHSYYFWAIFLPGHPYWEQNIYQF